MSPQHQQAVLAQEINISLIMGRLRLALESSLGFFIQILMGFPVTLLSSV